MPEEKKEPASRSAVVKKLKATKAVSVYQKEWFFAMKDRVEREQCDFAVLNADVPMEIFRAMDIPFVVKRIFYMYGSDRDVVRGQHANRRSEFVLINVSGQSKIRVDDGLGNEAVFSLNRPHTGIYLPPMIWKDMYDFSPDSILLVLSSEHYDAEEYIRDHDEFVREVNAHA